MKLLLALIVITTITACVPADHPPTAKQDKSCPNGMGKYIDRFFREFCAVAPSQTELEKK